MIIIQLSLGRENYTELIDCQPCDYIRNDALFYQKVQFTCQMKSLYPGIMSFVRSINKKITRQKKKHKIIPRLYRLSMISVFFLFYDSFLLLALEIIRLLIIISFTANWLSNDKSLRECGVHDDTLVVIRFIVICF